VVIVIATPLTAKAITTNLSCLLNQKSFYSFYYFITIHAAPENARITHKKTPRELLAAFSQIDYL
jgi:hypothetical protein